MDGLRHPGLSGLSGIFIDIHCSQGPYDEARTTLSRIIFYLYDVMSLSNVLKRPIDFGELKEPQELVCYYIGSMRCYYLHPLTRVSPLILLKPYLINRLSTLYCRFHNTGSY
jgi:hypothetical protein